ncbi:MAG: hypothetical protein ACLFUJ_15110 [Phycisphaerae bacterium]
MEMTKQVRPTLTAVEMDCGDGLTFELANGARRKIEAVSTAAVIVETNLDEVGKEVPGGQTTYRMKCRLRIDGRPLDLVRTVGTNESFYDPAEVAGLRIWFDACDDCFEFLTEDHGKCRPNKKLRLAIQDASLRICPPLLHPWCPLPADGLRIEDCYCADDCWMGAYFGAAAHGGLDINHPAGTPIWAPINLETSEMFDRVDDGANNNRWRGVRTWPDGSKWILQVHHVFRLLVDEGQPIDAGVQIAEGAGVLAGAHNHSHFVFKVIEPGSETEILLDPWILFRQMSLDRAATVGRHHQ